MTAVGVMGGGQLGQMLAAAGQRLGLAVRCYDPSPLACSQREAELTVGAFDDIGAVRAFARGCDVVTLEFENVPVRTLEALAQEAVVVRPSAGSLAVAQDRWCEKQVFGEIGLAVPRIARVDEGSDLEEAVRLIGTPAVLKTRRDGYDGKGQAVVREPSLAAAAWDDLGRVPCIMEEFVGFKRELSVVAARGVDGSIVALPVAENTHRDGILHRSVAPARTTEGVRSNAVDAATRLLHRLEHVGVLALELFETEDGTLLGNEFAPRVHNSGHWSMDAGAWSQFDLHLLAVTGEPLSGLEALAGRPAAGAMINLIGALPPRAGLDASGAHVHLYGKDSRPGRKLGHVTWTSEEPTDAAALADAWAGRWLTASAASATPRS